MSAASPPAERSGVAEIVAPVVAAFNLAIAQPLLDLLGRHAEFFVAHDASAGDVVLLGLGAALGVPLAAGLVLWSWTRLHPRSGVWAHRVVLAGLLGALALQILKRVAGSVPGGALVAISAVAGIAAVAALARSGGARRAVRLAGVPIGVAVAGLFLVVSPASKLVFAGEAAAAAQAGPVANPAPVVVVVLDEFPLSTLLDRRGGIDARLFPSFARLARDGTWFRNATGMHVSTPFATPAILDGRVPVAGKLPIAHDHPGNLFTMLGDAYEVHAIEPITDLCPDRICARPCAPSACPGGAPTEPDAPSLAARWRPMLADMRVVYLHQLLPESLTESLPRIDNAWEGFTNAGGENGTTSAEPDPAASPRPGTRQLFHDALARDRATGFRAWIRSIRPSAAPRLDMIHALLPHTPWDYTETGARFRPTPLLRGIRRTMPEDPAKAALYYQRHIVQARFTDRLIGELIAHLERIGVYDDALLVVVSDHGESFRPGMYARIAGPGNVGDIAPVPLFVKRPHERRGGPSDLPAMTIDVLPTIADVLGVAEPPATDGVSLYSPAFPARVRSMQTEGRPALNLSADGRERDESLRRKLALFGRAGEGIDPYAFGPAAALNGRTAASLGAAAGSASIRLSEPALYRSVGRSIVTPVTGYLFGRNSAGPVSIAVAVNGVVRSVTMAMEPSGGARPVVALVPPEAFRAGRNELRFFVVDTQGTVMQASCGNCP